MTKFDRAMGHFFTHFPNFKLDLATLNIWDTQVFMETDMDVFYQGIVDLCKETDTINANVNVVNLIWGFYRKALKRKNEKSNSELLNPAREDEDRSAGKKECKKILDMLDEKLAKEKKVKIANLCKMKV